MALSRYRQNGTTFLGSSQNCSPIATIAFAKGKEMFSFTAARQRRKMSALLLEMLPFEIRPDLPLHLRLIVWEDKFRTSRIRISFANLPNFDCRNSSSSNPPLVSPNMQTGVFGMPRAPLET